MAELSGITSGPGWGNKTSGTENLLSSDNYNDNRNLTEKAKDKLSSDRTDRPDDPVSGTNYGQSDSYGSGNNTSSYGDSSYGGNDNRGLADKAKDKLSSDRSDRPDNPVTGRNFDQDTSSSGYGGNTSSYGDSSYGGNDNRGLADKAKDKLSSDRSDRPDNPVTGRNYDQDTSSSGYGDNNNSSSYGSGNDNRGIGEKIKDKLSSKRSDQPDDPISGTNYGEDNSRGSSGGGLMDKVKAKIGGSGNNRNDNDSYGSSGNTYGGSDSYGSGNNNDRNY
ncbi:hypothetical protein CKM354_000807100 [Cercospora kikuchii]|uniref:Uncharacterized protein n=1 Tax=Cercospora kikuchii TaxID=84275 RepID=A0A9P3CM65_9PEZI|nr:uncharacterized protein CKM354_000807100 [Cercospora kikuchii]GIZ44886.1 hypothetical protein CKM354_000807100 [Cercospora kikuchii]